MNASGLDFEQVYEEYQPKILRYLGRLTDAAEAEDLTQEVFVKVSRTLESFRGEFELSTWLYRIATNTAIDKMRSADFRQKALESALDEPCESQANGIWPDEEALPFEEVLLRKERIHCFARFIQQLPLNYRLIVMLSELEELTCNEIAAILDLSQDVVKVRLHRGRLKLFQELKEHCKPEEWL